jgi:hypothetical protein
MTAVSWQTLLAAYLQGSSLPPLPKITTGAGVGRWIQLPHPTSSPTTNTSPPLKRLPAPFPTADNFDADPAAADIRLQHRQLSNNDLLQAQQADPLCSFISTLLTSASSILPPSPMANYARLLVDSCSIDTDSGLVIRQFTWRQGPRKGHTLHVIVLPESLVPRTLYLCHDCLGHHGRDKMMWYCQSRFFFSKMRIRIDNYLSSCSQCMRSFRDIRPAAFGHIESTGLLDSIGLDFAGPFRAVNEDGLQYLAIITDHHSKWLMVFATRSDSTADAIEALRRWVECTGTFPSRVFSDRGAFARSALYQDFLRSFGIHPQLTVALNPRGDGHAEAQVKNVKRILKKICIDHPFGWTDAARYAALVYNQSYHTTIGTSPYFVRHGSHPRTAADIVTGIDPPTEANWPPLIADQRCAIDTSVAASIAALGSSYDKRNASLRGARTFVVGDKVYLHQVYPESFDRAGVDVKLYPAFRPELFVVLDVVSPQLYRIQELGHPTGFNDIVHVQRLKPFRPRQDALNFSDFYDPLRHLDPV